MIEVKYKYNESGDAWVVMILQDLTRCYFVDNSPSLIMHEDIPERVT